MKLRLPKALFAAVLAACVSVPSSWASSDATTSYTLGDVMYVGDSITHGYYSASYRWALHKILVDNGVTYNEVGFNTDNTGGDYAGDSYRGYTFDNKHSATSGIRAWDVAGKTSKTGTTYVDSPINGVLDTLESPVSTFVLLLGTNDLLSDNNPLTESALATVTNNLLGVDRCSGDIGHIVDAMYESSPDAIVYVASIPCWTAHSNNDGAEPHESVAHYNESLKTWFDNYSTSQPNMRYVDVNRGLIDVSSEKAFYGVKSMFRSPSSDGLHPNSQGELIIAGNMARAMGIGGRTAGAERKAAKAFSRVIENAVTETGGSSNLALTPSASTIEFAWVDADTPLTPSGGYTAELMGFTFGNGAANGWNTTDNFSFTIGNGTSYGTLDINEAYIQWNGDVVFSDNGSQLFSYDMSTLTENIRMAYVVGDAANGIAGGYYVWLGDMLIGEALAGTTSTDAVNGVKLSYSGSSYYTLQGVAMDATGTYAPTIGLFNTPAANGCVVVPNNVVWTPIPLNENGDAYIYASNEAGHKGDVWVKIDSGQAKGWAAAQGNATNSSTDGNIVMMFVDEFKGSFDAAKADNAAGSVFGAVGSSGGVTGNVTLQFDAVNAKYNSFTSTDSASVVGSYQSNISGTFKAVINAGTFNYDIIGGVQNGANYSIGATDIYINGGKIVGNVYGGGVTGRIEGDTSVTITSLTPFAETHLTSDSIISAGGKISIDANKAKSKCTIGGDASLTFIGVTGEYKGTVVGEGYEGNVIGVTRLNVINSQLVLHDVENFDVINVSSGSQLTVSGNFTSAGGLQITGGSGTLKLEGDTNTFGGMVSVAAGNSLSVGGDVAFTGIDLPDLTYSYDESYAQTATTNGLGRALVTGLTVQDLFGGDGDVTFSENATITVNGLNVGTGANLNENAPFAVENAVYYVVDTPRTNSKADASFPAYSLGTDAIIPFPGYTTSDTDGVVHVGKHSYSGPDATEGANDALAFYVGRHGVLSIIGDSNTMTAAQILTTTQGGGDIILRSPGYTAVDGTTIEPHVVRIDTATLATGNLYISPIVLNDATATKQQTAAHLILDTGADISSFNSVLMGNSGSEIVINGQIGNATDGHGHIHNLALRGSSVTNLFVNAAANEELILSGDTCLRGYQHDNYGMTYAHLNVEMNRSGRIVIENLTSEDFVPASNFALYKTALYFNSSAGDAYDSGTTVDAVLDIESFDFAGYLFINAQTEGSLHINVNLLNNQQLTDYQYGCNAPAYVKGSQTLTIKGSGTYILSEGKSILDNFGVLSTEYAEDGKTRIWIGTVEVNNLVAEKVWNAKDTTLNGLDFADYGNEQSTIHFKGFKGHIFNTTTDKAYMNITVGSDLILENSSSMNAFELSNGYNGQVLNFEGDISGTGDFVISLNAEGAGYPNETFNFKGDLSQWKAAGEETPEIIVKKDTQAINFTDEAKVINVDLLTTGGTMNAAISNAEAVTVNSRISHEQGGTLNLTVNTAAGTTFNNTVDVDKLAVGAGAKATVADGVEASAGSVGMQALTTGGSGAELTDGITVQGSSVSGGRAENVAFSFDGSGSVSNVEMQDVSLTSLAQNASVSLARVTAKDVYLAGPVNFVALDDQAAFAHTNVVEAWGKNYNEVEFSTESFNGMILQASMTGQLTLTVSNEVDAWAQAQADALTNVTIVLKGFRVEGMQDGQRVEEWFSPLNILTDAAAVAGLSADTGTMTVTQLMNPDSYLFSYYEQTAQGLIIRMSNIPEPTTATMSLLALAALAARRRRK